uniref:Radial spoke head protein 9 homolog n=1 Tax=Salarias fasciatus TaxID=181472 RepID=A0A672GZM1_SALFA
MDSDLFCSAMEFVAGSGSVLTSEQKAAMQTSFVILKKNYKFERVLFWGKILGIKEDYFIVQGRGEDELKDRKNLYSFNCMDWFLLPPATESMINEVSKTAKGHFTGDPSFVYEQVGSDINLSEIDKLSVHQIDEEVSVVPRGAFIRTPQGLVHINCSFSGLSESEAKKLDNFLHFSEPKNLKKKSILELAGRNLARDFLDALSDDVPEGSWSLQLESGGQVCVIRSLLWPGLTFFHVPMTLQHGHVYIGPGIKNLSLPFQL